MFTIPTLLVQVCVKYVGTLMNGEVVDPINDKDIHTFKLGKRLTKAVTFVPSSESLDTNNTFFLLATGAGKVIRGWDIGISGYLLYCKAQLPSFRNDLLLKI